MFGLSKRVVSNSQTEGPLNIPDCRVAHLRLNERQPNLTIRIRQFDRTSPRLPWRLRPIFDSGLMARSFRFEELLETHLPVAETAVTESGVRGESDLRKTREIN